MRLCNVCNYVQILDVQNLLVQACQLMKMGGKHAKRMDLRCDKSATYETQGGPCRRWLSPTQI